MEERFQANPERNRGLEFWPVDEIESVTMQTSSCRLD